MPSPRFRSGRFGYFTSTYRIPLALLSLLIGNFLLYYGTLSFDFLSYDDKSILLNHSILYGGASFLNNLKEILFHYYPREEPLIMRDITWAIDSRIFGFTNPYGYHLGNVVLNAVNAAMLFAVLYWTTTRFRFALMVSAIFSLLPIHVEPVCWIMGRKDLLSTCFMLSALMCQALLLAHPTSRMRHPLYLCTIIFTIFALLSKISAVPFFIVLGLHRLFWPYLRGEMATDGVLSLSASIKKVIPSLVPHLAMSLIIFLWYRGVLDEWGMFHRGPGPFTLTHLKILAVFIPLVLFKYARLLTYPFNYSISYSLPSVSVPVDLVESIVSFVFLGLLLSSGWYFWRKRRDLCFYYFSFFVLMAPYFNIVYIGIWVANRYLYFSVFCILSVLVSLGADLYTRCRRPVRIALVTVFVSLLTINAIQSKLLQYAWKNNFALWSYEVEQVENPSLLALQSLAKYFVQKGESAIKQEVKRQYANKAERLIRKGIRTFKKLNYVQTDYDTPEKFYYARFFHLEGRVKNIIGEHPIKALDFFKRSYDINPEDAANTFYLFRMHKFLALHSTGAVSGAHARRALKVYAEFIRLKSVDRVWDDRILAELDDLEIKFPDLRSRVEKLKKHYLESRRYDR